MNENALAQILSAALGRQVNAAPSVANGGVAYRPTMQSSAPNNFMSMLLGALIGGGGNMGGGFNPVLYGGQPQAPQQRIPTFEEWMFQRTGGVVPTEPAIAQAETQTRPTVPQTGPTVNGKTYYPSPIPGSQNPQTPAGTTPMMPMVQPYKQGSWQMPQLPQMWNPYGFGGNWGGFGGFKGFGGYMGSGNSGYQQPQMGPAKLPRSDPNWNTQPFGFGGY